MNLALILIIGGVIGWYVVAPAYDLALDNQIDRRIALHPCGRP